MATYPQKVDLTAADIQRLMQSPDFISRRMQTLGDLRYIGTFITGTILPVDGGWQAR